MSLTWLHRYFAICYCGYFSFEFKWKECWDWGC